jgi:hypothetical protein
MTTPAPAPKHDPLSDVKNFSLVLGGPLFQLWMKLGITDDAMHLLRKRFLLIPLLCWLPLFVITAIEGRLLEGAVVPFLFDAEVHTRFLLAAPLLILAEMVAHQRLLPMLRQFEERALVSAEGQRRFDTAVASALRLRNSVLAELLLIAFVYGVGVLFIWRQLSALDTSTWYSMVSEGGSTATTAGHWYGYVSLPLFQFLLARWYFRLFIWGRLMWQVSRIPLNLVPTHPDRTGGLGFLAGTVHALAPILVAHGALLAGNLANRIFFLGAKLLAFKAEVAMTVVFMMLLVFAPLLAFAPQLANAKRKGRREYDALAQRYVREFDEKWLRGGAPADEALVGSGDIQSLADLGGSLDVIREMRVVPVTKDALITLAVATLAPLVPLLLTIMPLEELLKTLAGVLF